VRPLHEFDARTIVGIFTDLDDTLTTDGRLSATVLAALERLHAKGVAVVPVTGRSAGWCDFMLRLWPVQAVIGETGAFYMCRDGGGVRVELMQTPAEREATRLQRDRIAAQVLAQLPQARLAGDQPYRRVDLAIDIAEAVAPLDSDSVEKIVALMRSAGMHAQPSSIHVNGWFGQFDKGKTALTYLAREADVDRRDPRYWVCIGDAPNDQALFEAIPNSVGVANIQRHAARMQVLPRFVTRATHGAGFIELADYVLRARA
jgi:HAD superfamily hydrolase (TIGR01484 family)